MSAKNKKVRNKRYVPREPSFAALNAALTAQHTLDESQQSELIENARAAIKSIKQDPAPLVEHLDTLKIAIEMAVRLTETAVGGADYVRGLEDGLAMIILCRARHKMSGVVRFHGDEIRVIEAALDLHDALLEVASCRSIREAITFLRGHEYQPEIGWAV